MQLEGTILTTLLAACLLLLVSLPAHDVAQTGRSVEQSASTQCSCILADEAQLHAAERGILSCAIEDTATANYQ